LGIFFLEVGALMTDAQLLLQQAASTDGPGLVSILIEGAPNAGRKNKHISLPVLRIRDVYPGSRILIFTHSGYRISDPGSKNSNKRKG
jgi:hypothetical protein